MRTSATRTRDAGFTLIEMMAAIAVVSLLTALVLLAAPGPERQTRAFAERFAAFVARGGEESVVSNQPLALVIAPEGYGFARRQPNGWALITHGSPLALRAWPEGVSYLVEEGDVSEAAVGRVAVFDVLGGASPARIRLRRAGAEWRVTLDGGGEVHVAPAR